MRSSRRWSTSARWAARRTGAPGVYIAGRKVAALGLQVKRGCSYHGLALNVDMDLGPFRGIDPCGYPGLAVTQLRDHGFAGGVGADYRGSLALLEAFKAQHPGVPTKSGLMLGVGESLAEVEEVFRDLRSHRCEMLTLGQYLQPSRHHLPVERYVPPEEFRALGEYAKRLGFTSVASGPMVRSSYHADLQARGEPVGGAV